MILTVNTGDTLFSFSQKYGIPIQTIAADNGIVGTELVVGQSVVVRNASDSLVTENKTTVASLSIQTEVDEQTLFRNNFIFSGRQNVDRGTYVVADYSIVPQTQKIVGGYAYDFISPDRLLSVINYLTYVIPFTYGFTYDGTLVVPDDAYILEKAESFDVKPLMHISTLTNEGSFDSNLPALVFENPLYEQKLIDNIVENVVQKNYDGVDVDFEYLPQSQKQNYVDFIIRLSQRLHEIGKILVVALPPKTSDEQQGLLVEGIDYAMLGQYADYLLLMVYEYGYRFGPPLAIAPLNQIRKVVDYAITKMPCKKILLGLSNYGYDWTLPFVRGESDAPSISTVQAIELAKKYRTEIEFDEESKAPFFFYTDNEGREHEVWYEDARSFEAKFQLIMEYNLAGGFIWELNRENPQGYVTINSVVKIV